MPRDEDWKREAREAIRREAWSLAGPSMVVKVVSMNRGLLSAGGGYITLCKYLAHKTPLEIQKALGLRDKELQEGARIFRFTRLPQSSEYEYDLTAKHPGGLVGRSDDVYPPGSDKIHQWKIKTGVQIPVDQTNFVELRPDERFPFDWPHAIKR